MSTIADKELVKHILEETAFILDHTNGISKEAYLNDAVLCRATIITFPKVFDITPSAKVGKSPLHAQPI